MATSESPRENPEESVSGISSSDSQLLERLIFRKHYSQLTTLLFQTNLTPHLVTEGVLVPLDVGDISSAATAAKKAELVLLKIAGSLDAHFPNSFHKLIKVMKTYGNDDLKQLAIIMENEGYAAKDAITADVQVKLPHANEISVFEPTVEFGALLSDIQDILEEKFKSNLNKLKTICFNLRSKENALLLNSQEIAKIKACSSVYDLFIELRGLWRYDHHPLLLMMVKKSGSKEAMEKIKMFRNKMKYHKKLKEVYDHSKSSQIPLPDGYSKMVAIVEKDYDDITLEECEEIEKMLLSYFGGPALRPPTYEPSNSIKITWYIPTEAIDRVLKRAHQATEIFPYLSISFFEVSGIVIWNKKWPHSLRDLQQDNKSKGDALSAKEREVDMLTATVDQLDSENKELQRQVSQLKEDLEKQSQSFTPTANENDTPIDEDHGYHLREIDRLREKPSVDDKPFDSGFDSVPTGESAGSEDTDKPLVPKRTDASRDFDKSLVKKLKEKDEKLKEKDDQVTKLQFELSKLKMERITVSKAKQPPSDLQTKNDQLTNEVEQLTEQITQLRSNQTSLSTENKDLQKQNEDLQEMLQQLKSDMTKLEEEQAKEEDAVQDVNKNMAIFQLEQSLHGDAESFTNILNEKEDQISKLQSEMSKLKSEQVKDPKQVAQPSKDFANLQRRNDELANEVRKLTIQVTSLSGNKTSLSTENRSLQQQTKRLEETVTQLKADISKLEDDNMQQAKKFEESDAEVSVLKTENQELRKSVFTDTTASQKIAELEQSLQEQADSFTNIVKEKEDEISKVQLEISKLKSEKIVDTKSVQPSKDIAALQRRNDELANEVGKLTKQITTISSGKTSLSTENRSLQERNKSLEATVTQLEDDKLLHAKRSTEMDAEMRDLKTEIQKLQKSASSVDTTASQKIFELEQSLQEQENSFTNIVKEKEDEISKLQSENSKLKSEKVQDVQVAKPPKENAKLQRKNNELATEVEQLTKQVSQLRGSKTTLSNENRDLQQTVVQLKADNSKLEKEKHQESEKLNQQINALQSENRKLARKKIVSEDQGYHSKEVATLPEKPPISAKPTLMMTGTLQEDSSKNITQAEMDKSLQQQAESYTNVLDEKESTINKLQSEIRTLKTQKEKDAKTNDTATLRQKNSDLTSENDSLNREVSLLHSDIATLKQKSEDAKKLQDEIERLKVEIQKSVSTTSDVRQKNSKLTSDFTALQKQKSEEAKKFQDEIDRLRRENQKLRNPVSADQGFFGSNELDTLPQEPVTTEQQLWKRVKEAESTVDALKQELHDQQDSYEGLMNENEETIQKLQRKLKEAGETKTKEEQEESKSYASLDFQQIMANRRQATEKEDTQ